MTKTLLNTSLLLVLSASLIGRPARLLAQNQPAADKKSPASQKQPAEVAKKPSAGPFHGKLAALDKLAKTITVGKRTLQITSATRLNRGGKPATLEDGVVGEECSGYVKPTDDGKWMATTVNFGPKREAAGLGTKKESTPKPDQK